MSVASTFATCSPSCHHLYWILASWNRIGSMFSLACCLTELSYLRASAMSYSVQQGSHCWDFRRHADRKNSNLAAASTYGSVSGTLLSRFGNRRSASSARSDSSSRSQGHAKCPNSLVMTSSNSGLNRCDSMRSLTDSHAFAGCWENWNSQLMGHMRDVSVISLRYYDRWRCSDLNSIAIIVDAVTVAGSTFQA